jgi:4-hydroxybenzoate polyprenyltransferase
LNRLATYLSFIRFSHSVFALPFALTGALLAWQQAPFEWRQILWVIVAMVSARSAAMGFNRLVDARWDALNPRTAMREIPRGALSARDATIFVIVTSIVFVAAAFQLNRLCGMLSPVSLAIVFWYSLAKRYTSYTQAFLGLAMAVAPIGGWLAAGGPIDSPVPWLLGLAIGLWVGGFDILYACQDVEFDRGHGLNSIPVRFGVAQSLVISRVMHVATVACMAAMAWLLPLGPIYLGGVAMVAALLVYEQSLVSATDLSQVKRAFDLNGWVGILYFMTTGLALYVR